MDAPTNGILERVALWRNLQFDGVDHCELRRTREGFSLTGTVIGVLEDKQQPIKVEYEIHCDVAWCTNRVRIDQMLGRQPRSLSLTVESIGRWREDGRDTPGLAECTDIDLGITPATNTLPIRRLGLRVGQSEHVTAAWIKFPELTIQPLKQIYTRLSDSIYRYESSSGFSADLEVDDIGLVITYPGGWKRLAGI